LRRVIALQRLALRGVHRCGPAFGKKGIRIMPCQT
jgi:hypothetical protein